jgi:acetylornithine deacetylase/succinyl-diaminopimelate desuccinylase-like protein
MTLTFKHLDFTNPVLEMLEPNMEVNGKRATAYLHFQIRAGEEIVGSGFKKLAVSGLRDYEEQPLQAFVDEYLARKNDYLGNLAVAGAV